jgi:hypothetical protein
MVGTSPMPSDSFGELSRAALPSIAPTTSVATDSASPEAPTTLRTTGLIVGGVGVAALVGGGVTAILGFSKKSDLDDRDAFVSRIDASGVTQWTRQFGTTSYDYLEAVDVDSSGNVIVVGHTIGTRPGQTSLGLVDAFVRKYSPTGEGLWTAQFGSSANDSAYGGRGR